MQHYCEIPTPKGTLRGFFHKPNQDKHPVCLIFHGFTGQKTGTKFSYVQLSRMLESKGIASFRFDFLGSGESDGNFVDMTFQDELSCARVILEECLKMENCTEIYVLGHSMGGAIASELAKLYPDVIKKMVLWAPAFNLPDALFLCTRHMVWKSKFPMQEACMQTRPGICPGPILDRCHGNNLCGRSMKSL